MNPHHIAVVSQMCINIGIIATNPNTNQNHITSLRSSKLIPCIKFERFGIICFRVMLQTNKQTNRQRQTPRPIVRAGMGKYVSAAEIRAVND